MEKYRILLNSTVELYKANDKIAKLESLIEKKNAKIEHLKTQLERATATAGENFSSAGFSEVRFQVYYETESIISQFCAQNQ